MTRRETVVQLLEGARRNNHRQLLVVSGDRDWTIAQAEQIQSWLCVHSDAHLWVSQQAPAGSNGAGSRDLHRYLGRETELLVFDAWDGFNPNAFGQISGTVCGGGLLILLCPELNDWHEYEDPEHKALVVEPYGVEAVGRRFIRRLVSLIHQEDQLALLTADGFHAEPYDHSIAPRSGHNNVPAPYASADQQKAVDLIIKTLSRGRRPVVMTADRGRGKSAALGITASQLMRKGANQVWVTAPSIDSVAEVFTHAAAQLAPAQVEKGRITCGSTVLQYIAPDDACRIDGHGAVLLVDEAAAIPAPVLTRLLDRFPRIVFSTTVHGYEGTGQGFAVRFRRELDRRTPNWKAIELLEPIRWSEGDPLETFIFESLLLNAEALSEDEAQQCDGETLTISCVERDQLLADDVLLKQLFGLLVLAHYRTTPGDLRILLDSPNLTVWVAQQNNQVVGAALIAEEGPISVELAQALWEGTRRPKGHLLPQTVIGQEGYLEAAPLRCGRIMRIAVHPMLQRQGVARQMLREIAEYGMQHQWDYLGSSFGATEELLLFWQNNGFGAIRLGENRDAVSGTHAALVCRPLSDPGRLMFNHLRDRFTQQLPLLLGYNLRDLEVEVLPMLLQGMRFDTDLSRHDLRDLEAFVQHNRSYESCIAPIRKLVIRALKNRSVWHALTPDELSLLVSKALQQRSWEEINAESGRKTLMRRMRALIGECLRLS